MVKIISKDSFIITLIITLVSVGGYIINDTLVGAEQFTTEQIAAMISDGNWYYCELENSLKQCSELKKYSVIDAKCVMLSGKGDICTISGVRLAWKPFSEYVGVKLSDPFVEAILLQEITFYNETTDTYINCTKWNYNLSDCISWVVNGTNNSCVNWSKIYYNSSCFNDTIIVLKNYSTFKSLGFNVNYTDKTYQIMGVCCSFYNESPYKQFAGLPVISCKEIVGGVCNPLIQQTSKDTSVFDEYGRIYVIRQTHVEPFKVGSYDYVNNYGINPSKLEVKR